MNETSRHLQSGGLVSDLINRTSSEYTLNVGPWMVGSNKIDNKCRTISDLERVTLDAPFQTARAMGILATLSGFLAIVAACFGVHKNSSTRRVLNYGISGLYLFAGLAASLTMTIFGSKMCSTGEYKAWGVGDNNITTVEYGGCQCRAGCILSIVVALLYFTAGICVLF